jgi:hypothetical protein
LSRPITGHPKLEYVKPRALGYVIGSSSNISCQI